MPVKKVVEPVIEPIKSKRVYKKKTDILVAPIIEEPIKPKRIYKKKSVEALKV